VRNRDEHSPPAVFLASAFFGGRLIIVVGSLGIDQSREQSAVERACELLIEQFRETAGEVVRRISSHEIEENTASDVFAFFFG
jgi:hypothetical protein